MGHRRRADFPERPHRALPHLEVTVPEQPANVAFGGADRRWPIGYAELELVGTPFLELVHPDDRARAMRLDAMAGEAEGGMVETFRVIGVDNVQRHVQSWSTVIPADGASARVVAGAVVDVSRQVEDRVELEPVSYTHLTLPTSDLV